MTKYQNLVAMADRLVSQVVRYASVGDWSSVQKYEAQLRECQALLGQSQSPGF